MSHLSRGTVSVLSLCVLPACLFTACAAPFSEMQGARMAAPKSLEITPTYTRTASGGSEGTYDMQSQIGVHGAYGASKNVELRARYERVTLSDEFSGDVPGEEKLPSVNVLSVGVKFPLLRDRIAFYLPVGFGFGGEIETSETFQTHPTMLLSLPVGNALDVNTSVKALIPINDDNSDVLVAYNIGLGINLNDRKWVLRPEVGFLRKPNESGFARQLSVGITRGFRQ